MLGRVLIIAGSDSGGGAGIQGDIKTVSAIGSYASTAITALTAQNTVEVSAIHPVPAPFVYQQIVAVLSDIGADVIKTGMLLNQEIIEKIADALQDFAANTPLIIDPVMIAKSGDHLLSLDAISCLKERLIKGCTLLTPNIPEAEALLDISINNADQLAPAAHRIKDELGAQAVLLKGGHLSGNNLVDILVTQSETIMLESSRIDTPHTHGTGCAYASATAAFMAQNFELPDAVTAAHAYVAKAIATAPALGKGHGPLNHFFLTQK